MFLALGFFPDPGKLGSPSTVPKMNNGEGAQAEAQQGQRRVQGKSSARQMSKKGDGDQGGLNERKGEEERCRPGARRPSTFQGGL